MALVHDKFLCTILFRDSGVDITKKTVEIRGATLAEAAANAAAHVPVWAAASQAAVDGYHLTEVFREDAPQVIAGDTVRNTVQAVVTVTLATSPLKKGTIVIPAPENACFAGVTGEDSDKVLSTAALVTGLVDEFKATGNAFLSDGEDAAATPNISGYRRTLSRKLA